MNFDYVVPITPRQFLKAQLELSKNCYPAWVTISTYAIIVFSIVILTFIINQPIQFLAERITSGLIAEFTFLPAILLAVLALNRFILPRVNSYFIRFAKFDTDYDFTCRYEIDETGITISEGDRFTRIDWTAITGVHTTKSLIAFYCRGLQYYIPREAIGDLAAQEALIAACRAWQTSSKTGSTAKVFV